MPAQNSLQEHQYVSARHAGLDRLEQSHSIAFDEGSRLPHGETQARKKGTGFSESQVTALWRHIEAHIQSQIPVEEFSRVIGFSQWHFSRCFKVEFGRSPHRFIVEHRIQHAKGLLLNSPLTIAEIALESGFADQAHLSRSFNQHVGLSPGRWRRKNRAQGAR